MGSRVMTTSSKQNRDRVVFSDGWSNGKGTAVHVLVSDGPNQGDFSRDVWWETGNVNHTSNVFTDA